MSGLRTERVVLASVIFVTLLAQVLLYPGVPEIVEGLGATTDLDASMWFLAAEFGSFIVCAGIWGYLSDRTGTRIPYIALGAGIAATCYFILTVGGIVAEFSFGTVILLRIIQGAGSVAAFSLAMTMLMDLEGGHGQNMGAAGIAIGLGTAFGAPSGGLLAGVNPLAPLLAAGILFVTIPPLLLLVSDRAPTPDSSTIRTVLRDLRRYPELGIPYTFGFIDRMTAGTFSLVGVFFFRDAFGLDAAQTGVMLFLFFGPFALLQYPFGRLSDRFGRFLPVVGGSICYGSMVIAFGQAPSLVLAGAILLGVGIFGAVVSPATMALVTDIAPTTRHGTAMAGFNIAGSLGFLTGILLGGVVAGAYGNPMAFAVIGSAELLIALIALPWFRRVLPHSRYRMNA